MKKIKKIQTGFFSRHYKMGKIVTGLAKDLYFSKREQVVDKISEALSGKIEGLTEDLDQLKGSFVKAGQLLSLYAEDVLPPEVDNLLKKLQSETNYLDWNQISKQIDQSIIDKLEINHTPFAAASIGQVHRASDGVHDLVLKIQYQNIHKVIDMDLRMLKLICKSMKFIPKSLDLDSLFIEIKQMLLQEMDYQKEITFMQEFRRLAADDYIVPLVFPEYSSRKVICSSFIDGENVETAIKNLSQDERNKLAKDFFTLFFKELTQWKMIQSDAHLGNYLIKDKKWVLLDFGATKKISDSLAESYHELIVVIASQDKERIRAVLDREKMVDWTKTNEELLWKYFKLISTPFTQKTFDWGNSTISKDAMNMSKKMLKDVQLNQIPHQTFFIDRKISGLYYMLKILGANGDIIPRDFLHQKNQ